MIETNGDAEADIAPTVMADIVIVGGGLAGGLIALAIDQARPELRIALIEAGKTLGGNHRWSWFESDLDEAGHALLEPFRKTEWENGYDVRFPEFRRKLSTPYHSMTSGDFHGGLARLLAPDVLHLGSAAHHIDARGVTLENGERIGARTVIDCRNFEPSEHLEGGWQVFMGRTMKLDQPHGLERPVIMDATVDQVAPHGNGGAYRFVYLLPLAAHEVFVEDTYYADEAQLDRGALSSRIDQYCTEQGWKQGTPAGHETGLLPVLTGGNFRAYQNDTRIDGVVTASARGGFTHPLTSYTIPIAVENALMIAQEADLPGPQLAAIFEARARRHWKSTSYYRMLARMMFLAAKPNRRVAIFQRFYRLNPQLIERFYSARSTFGDKIRVLSGKPPVSIAGAIGAIFQRGKSLKTTKQSETTA
ncbi:MAG: lycopene beta-cyclase CrtY [Erythrobacter sp.]